MEGSLRQIDASDFIIPTDIAQDVGQLKCEAQLFTSLACARVAKAKDVKAGEPDRAGDPVAVLAQMVEGGVGGNTEVHLRAGDEIVEVAGRNAEAPNRIGKSRRSEERRVGKECRS